MRSYEYDFDPIEDERAELKAMVAWDRKRSMKLAEHPDPRDPDWPGHADSEDDDE